MKIILSVFMALFASAAFAQQPEAVRGAALPILAEQRNQAMDSLAMAAARGNILDSQLAELKKQLTDAQTDNAKLKKDLTDAKAEVAKLKAPKEDNAP